MVDFQAIILKKKLLRENKCDSKLSPSSLRYELLNTPTYDKEGIIYTSVNRIVGNFAILLFTK